MFKKQKEYWKDLNFSKIMKDFITKLVEFIKMLAFNFESYKK